MTSHSQMKKPEVDMVEGHHHPKEIPIDPTHLQHQTTAAAQVEIYPTTKYIQDNHRRDLNHSVSPQGDTMHWNTQQIQSHSNARGADRGRARQDDHNSGKFIFLIIFNLLLFKYLTKKKKTIIKKKKLTQNR